MGEDVNVIMSLIKTGVHGEFSYNGMSALLAWGLDYVHTALLILTVVSAVYVIIKRREFDKTQIWSALWLWLLMLASYIQFNFAYPYMCTADFRYMLLWQPASAALIAYFTDNCRINSDSRPRRYSFYVSAGITALFCGMCVLHFC